MGTLRSREELWASTAKLCGECPERWIKRGLQYLGKRFTFIDSAAVTDACAGGQWSLLWSAMPQRADKHHDSIHSLLAEIGPALSECRTIRRLLWTASKTSGIVDPEDLMSDAAAEVPAFRSGIKAGDADLLDCLEPRDVRAAGKNRRVSLPNTAKLWPALRLEEIAEIRRVVDRNGKRDHRDPHRTKREWTDTSRIESLPLDIDTIMDLRAAIANLPSDLRKIMEMRYPGMTVREIGTVIGMSPTYVQGKVALAIVLMRDSLE